MLILELENIRIYEKSNTENQFLTQRKLCLASYIKIYS